MESVDETLVLITFQHLERSGLLSNTNSGTLSITGLDTSSPRCHFDGFHFQGSHEIDLGSSLHFRESEDGSHMVPVGISMKRTRFELCQVDVDSFFPPASSTTNTFSSTSSSSSSVVDAVESLPLSLHASPHVDLVHPILDSIPPPISTEDVFAEVCSDAVDMNANVNE